MVETMTEKQPFFSVIIPTYNRCLDVVNAVESVLAQTYVNLEVIVIDDGSTDDTASALQKLKDKDARVIYVFQENQERSAARNKGIKLAKGEYICFLDSDDLYLPDHLEVFLKSIKRRGQPVSMFLSNTCSMNGTERVMHTPFVPISTDPLELVLKAAICSQQVCLHNEILCKHQFNVDLRIGEDQELWVRIVQEYPLVKTNKYTVVIQDLGDRTIDLRNTRTFIENIDQKKLIIQNDKAGRISPEWRKFILSAAYFRLAQSYLLNGQLLRFYFYLFRSLLLSPKIYVKEKVKLFLNPRVKNY